MEMEKIYRSHMLKLVIFGHRSSQTFCMSAMKWNFKDMESERHLLAVHIWSSLVPYCIGWSFLSCRIVLKVLYGLVYSSLVIYDMHALIPVIDVSVSDIQISS